METRRKTWETKYICREMIRSVRSELEDIVVIVLDEMLNGVVQGNIEEYNQGVAIMMEIGEDEFDDMDWSQKYDWMQDWKRYWLGWRSVPA